MLSIDGITAGDSRLPRAIDSQYDKNEKNEAGHSPAQSGATQSAGIRVTLSGLGSNSGTASRRSENSDIEESGLPDNIQSILKMIRELKEQIAQRQAELQAVLADKRQNAEQMQTKSGNLRNTIAGLNSGLMSAYARLNKAIKGSGLSGDQMMKVASLLAKF